MRIGITERGDAGKDFLWYSKLRMQDYDGAILITKEINSQFVYWLMNLYNTFPNLIVHCTCTGWGCTNMEPNVPDVVDQLSSLQALIQQGFPKRNCVLRVDPIIPTSEGRRRAHFVIDTALEMGLLPDMRVRVSVIDMYEHCIHRFRQLGMPLPYGDKKYANRSQMNDVYSLLMSYPQVTFETCAEPYLSAPNVVKQGCVSLEDLKIMGIDTSSVDTNNINGQKRTGCTCLSIKSELLEQKHSCSHKCLYCYWRD